jgi:hypothetical protein
MIFQTEARRRGNAAGLGESSFLDRIDGPKNPTKYIVAQGQTARRRRLIENLHRLGPAPLGHFLNEVEVATGADVTVHLERYSEIDPEFVRALGGDRFAPILWPIDGSRA